MSILIDKTTRVIVQGITGRDGEFHTRKMIAYGTQVVGGVSPGKGGTNVQGVPVFNTVYKAVQQTKANTSIIFVPARFAADCIMEAADAGISLIICKFKKQEISFNTFCFKFLIFCNLYCKWLQN